MGDRLRLARLLLRRQAGRVRRLLGAPFRLLKHRGTRVPERLVIAPQDIRTTDPTTAADIYGGYFAFAGKSVTAAGRSVFALAPPTAAWAEALAGFGWLRHLRAADSALSRANARALIGDWIALRQRRRGPDWEPGVASRRLISWLTQSPLILDGADGDFYRRFMRQLARHASFLAGVAAQDRAERLPAALALAYYGLCVDPSGAAAQRAFRALADELDRQILPDGGHVSRNPRVLVDLMIDLLPLRQGFASQGIEIPKSVLSAMDRMMPMLRLFRHGEGTLARFNGMSATPADLLATLLTYTDTRGQAIENAPHAGYQRLHAGGSTVIIDTGAPPPRVFSSLAHAGCLSFEFSDGASLLIVNCGAPPPGGEQWRAMARSTAAHSTLVVADTSSCRFVSDRGDPSRAGAPSLTGPRNLVVGRERGPDHVILRASHDGYRKNFGVLHERRLALAADGGRLAGQDALRADEGRPRREALSFALRFHLHPAIHAELTPDGRSVALAPPAGPRWTFDAGGLPLAIEDSVFFAAPDGPRRTKQIVVSSVLDANPDIEWRLIRDR